MRIESVLANVALCVLGAVVIWDAVVWFGLARGHTITEEIRGSWRSWLFFALAGAIAGGHFLRGK